MFSHAAKHTRTTIVLALFSLAAGAAAADSPFYLFGKLAESTTHFDLQDRLPSSLEGEDDAFGFGVGFRFGEHWAVQAEYQDLGEAPGDADPCGDPDVLCVALVAPTVAETELLSISLLPHIALSERWLLFGKVGLASWQSDVSGILDDPSTGEFDDEELLLGGGFRFEVSDLFGLYAEYERSGEDLETAGLGLSLGF